MRGYEKKLAREAKINPKVFYKYSQSKLKTNNVLGNRQGRNDTIASTPKDKAEIYKQIFSSVFTDEILAGMPEFTTCKDSNMSNTIFTPDLGQNQLQQLNVKKSPGIDKMHLVYCKKPNLNLLFPCPFSS